MKKLLTSKRFSHYAPVVLRLALTAVFLWFGTSQLLNTNMWIGLVPVWATSLSGMSAVTIVHMNGVFEVIAGVLLALGVFVRLIAILLFAHLLVITSHLGLTPVGVRDFGLSFATLALALFGDDMYCLTHSEEHNS